MLQGKDIIIVGQQAWDIDIGSNCKDIALQLSKNNRVLYVNPPLDRISKIKFRNNPKVRKRLSIIKTSQNNLNEVSQNLWSYYPDILIESINWIPFHYLFRVANRYNNELFAVSIRKAIRALSFHNYVLFNDSDMFRSFHLKELLNPSLSAYYSRDNLTASGYWRRHGRRMEPKLISKSDYCFANSEYLMNYCRKYNDQSYYVGQGCDFSFIKETLTMEKPVDISKIKYPIIGYVGALTSLRLDINLLEYIANKAPHINIVLIGPEDRMFKKSKLHLQKNVFFLGMKQPNELSSYIKAFDVCINPQVLNAMTIGNYPRKVDEYLALGKPVVATRTEAMAQFSSFVHLADNKHQFLDLIEYALKQSQDPILVKARIEFALSHSWENSVNKIGDYLNDSFSKAIIQESLL